MNRVEYMDPNLNLSVIDNYHRRRGECEASSTPDHLVLQNWSEVRVDMVDGVNTQTHS